MLSLLPDFADPLRLCALGKVYEGKLDLADMPRLSPLLTSSEGEAAFALVFDMNADKRPVVTVSVEARLMLCCQRCMQPMPFDVASSTRLGVVSGPDEAERLPDDLDPLLLEQDRLALRSLVEDELILSVPPAPMHPVADCEVSLNDWQQAAVERTESDASTRDNPFAALAALKSDENEQD